MWGGPLLTNADRTRRDRDVWGEAAEQEAAQRHCELQNAAEASVFEFELPAYADPASPGARHGGGGTCQHRAARSRQLARATLRLSAIT